jgi:hypothetical protein
MRLQPLLIVALATLAAPADAGSRQFHSPDAYRRCVVAEAVRGSYGADTALAIVEGARRACAALRPDGVGDDVSAEPAALPFSVDAIREQRRTADALYGIAPAR